ncbi:MAG: protein translocase SEC61 complex subunit gamma [Candidatus Marsarchaeota archaeon]|jgi:protein translocase SEC61 complex gamma subunit|nr:protein translocase SEC61 complex subunit gamma [Candidatus Marsarchaeota archaeon]
MIINVSEKRLILVLNVKRILKSFYSDSKHVLSVSYKPDLATFKRTLKIVLLGTVILGLLGFIITEIIQFATT